MAITFSCSHCGKSLTTSDDKAGRKAKCPGCGEVLKVPESDVDSLASDDAADEDFGDDELPEAPRAARSGTRVKTQTCPMCGAKNPRRARTCEECGEKLTESIEDERVRDFEYAGFWMRFAAAFIDNILLSCLSGMVGLLVGIVIGVALVVGNNGNPNAVNEPSAQLLLNAVGYVIGIVISWLYFASMESSAKQATLGKMALGLKVCDLNGRRISFAQATGRYFGKILSGLICFVGYIMAGFTEKKQALHDQLAGTLVVRA